jgi:hypothetical protein
VKFVLSLLLVVSNLHVQAYPKVHIDTLIDFTADDSAALSSELKILQKILSTDTFWEAILNANYYCANWRRLHHYRRRNAQYPKWKKDKHIYSSKEIQRLLWTGDDEIGLPKDGLINLKLKAKDYEQNKKGLTRHGGTDRNTLIISSNRKTRIHSGKKGTYACHLLHEYMHVLGFKHPKSTPSKTKKKCGGDDVTLTVQKIGIATLRTLN